MHFGDVGHGPRSYWIWWPKVPPSTSMPRACRAFSTSAGSRKRDGAIDQQKDLVDVLQQGWTLRDGDHGDLLLLRVLERAHQGDIARGIQVRVRLIQDDEMGIAEEGTRQRDALLLTTRKRRAVGCDHRLVAVRKGRDHLVHICQHGRAIDLLVIRIGPHPGDVRLDRSGKS